jgi:hypothetical protein
MRRRVYAILVVEGVDAVLTLSGQTPPDLNRNYGELA